MIGLPRWAPYAALAALLIGSHWWAYNRGVTNTDNTWLAAQAEQGETAERTEREKEQATRRKLEDIQRDSTQTLVQVRDRADAAESELGRLHQRLADLQAGAERTDTGSATQCQATRQAAMVLTGLYERDSKRLGEVSAAYEAARLRGLTCEQAWDSLRGGAALDQ